MSVNIYDGTNLTPIAGKTVPAPTPDYVDEQFNPSTTYSKGMTCIDGNVRYKYKNSTETSGHRPPDTTYWEVLSVASQLIGTIDESVFADYANFTKMQPNNSRFSILTEIGGYKVVGNYVYIYALLYPDKTKFGSGFQCDYTIARDSSMPLPVLPYVPLQIYENSTSRAFDSAVIYNGGESAPQLDIGGTAQNLSSGGFIVIKGVYEKA